MSDLLLQKVQIERTNQIFNFCVTWGEKSNFLSESIKHHHLAISYARTSHRKIRWQSKNTKRGKRKGRRKGKRGRGCGWFQWRKIEGIVGGFCCLCIFEFEFEFSHFAFVNCVIKIIRFTFLTVTLRFAFWGRVKGNFCIDVNEQKEARKLNPFWLLCCHLKRRRTNAHSHTRQSDPIRNNLLSINKLSFPWRFALCFFPVGWLETRSADIN